MVRERQKEGGGGRRGTHTHTHLILPTVHRCLYLFLILVLHAESLLDAVASLQEGLPLGSLRQDAHEHPRQVDAGEEHRVGDQLHTEGEGNKHAGPFNLQLLYRTHLQY